MSLANVTSKVYVEIKQKASIVKKSFNAINQFETDSQPSARSLFISTRRAHKPLLHLHLAETDEGEEEEAGSARL